MDSAHEVTNDKDRILLAADFMHGNDVGMIQLGGGAGLAQELFDFAWLKFPVARNLHSHRAVQLDVASFPHRAEASQTKALDEFKVPEALERPGRPRLCGITHQIKMAAATAAGNVSERRIGEDLDRLVTMRAADS